MLRLTKEQTADDVVLTLNERVTLTAPHFLFVARHTTTKETVRFVLPVDQSLFQSRYNEFTLNTSVLFASASLGQWLYNVYEQASSSNIDETGLNEVENGRLDLVSDEAFAFTPYETATNFKTYGG